MKKRVLLAAVSALVLAVCVFFGGCFGSKYEKVADKSYEYSEITYNKDELMGVNENTAFQTQLARYTANETGMVIRFADGKAYYKKGAGTETEYDYKQDGGNVVVYNGPYKNTNYNGEIVCGYTIDEKAETLTLHVGSSFSDTGHAFELFVTYKLVETQEEVAE